MKRAIIFANGELRRPPAAWLARQPGDLLIAVDGGARHCQSLGLRPDVVIGDFDSLEPNDLARLRFAGATLIQHPARKDETDLELAFQHARAVGVEEIIVLGALGARWDMTLANLLLPAQPGYAGVGVRLVDGGQEIALLRGGESLGLRGRAGDTISLIPLSAEARGITTTGLEYPLQDETLFFGSSRGVSNTLLGEQAQVRLGTGILLCVKTSSIDQGDVK
jgi:thiamine pyrophosphokinase